MPKNNDQAVSHPPRPLLTALEAAASRFFPTLTPLSRKASLSSTALPKDLLVLFTSIANNEEAVGAQAQTSSLLQNVRVPGCLGLPGPWERPEMQRSFSPPLSGCWTTRVRGPGPASSGQGTNTVVRGGQARHGVTPGRHQLAQSLFPPLVLPSFFPYWAHTGQGLAGWTVKPRPKALNSWTTDSHH